jgi:hypothetical protein
MDNYDTIEQQHQQLRHTHIIPFTSKEFVSEENNNPSQFSTRIPNQCLSQMLRSHQLLNIAGEPTHSLEILDISITGLFTSCNETIVITLRGNAKETNSTLHSDVQTHTIRIPGGSYSEEELVNAINFRTEFFFKLEWYCQLPGSNVEKRLYLLSVLDSKQQKRFPNSTLHISALLATKLGFLIPSSVSKGGPKTISLPLIPLPYTRHWKI